MVCSRNLSQPIEYSMDSNGTNILRQTASHMFNIRLCTGRSSGYLSIIPSYSTQSSFASRTLWPAIHQTSISTSPETLFNANSHPTIVDASATIVACTSSVLTPAQSQNTINATETVPILDECIQRLVESTKDYHKEQESGGCGLENFGRSCYINSALQCLCHIRPFLDIILNLQEQHNSQLPPITSAYARLLTEMQSIRSGSTSAREVKARISELNRRFAGTDEQDSHEFLTVLLETLHQELLNNYEDSSIGDLMHGTIRSTVRCLQCEAETITDDSFLSLPLPIRRPAPAIFEFDTIQNIFEKSIAFLGFPVHNDITLYDCLKDFLTLERLGGNGQWFCQNCQKLTDATKKFDLWHVPRVLILQLKRFTYDLTNDTKVTTKIRAEPVLDLERFVKNGDTDHPPLYDLVAVLTHSGTLSSGHYTTFARHLSNCCWYYFDDRHVRQASLDEVTTSDAYVLVYKRRHFLPSV